MEARHKASFLALQDILGDPGTVSRVGRKGGTNVFITGERAPGYRNSPDHFQKFKRMPAPDWAQKCFVLLCPIGEHISMSSFRVFVHDGYGLDHGLSSVLLGYAPKKCTQSGNFQFDIKSSSDPTRLICQMQGNSSEPYQSLWREWILLLLVYSFAKREVRHFHG